jgi:hypothetical protein
MRCAQISYSMQSRILWLCACRRLIEDNKREEELVGVAPGWELTMHILCCYDLCDVLMCLCVCLLSSLA